MFFKESSVGSRASSGSPASQILTVRHPYIILALILLVSAALHLVRIGTPDRPVFDEAYFATYAANDALQTPYFDIHPPLGRLFYSIPLFFYDNNDLKDATYVVNEKTQDGKSFITKGIDKPYGTFPYVTERMVGVFFGLLLIFSVFLFVRELAGEGAALLTSFFVAFENALLLDTRLILMDGMYLSFGLLALYFFFKKMPRPWIAGLFFGLALSVKLTAVVFIGPVVAATILKSIFAKERVRHHDVLSFLGVAAIVFLILFVGINNLLFTPAEQLSVMGHLFNIPSATVNPSVIKATLLQFVVGSAGYTAGGTNPMMSPWYLWPFMMKPIRLTNAGTIVLVGNVFVWIASTLAVLTIFFYYAKRIMRRVPYGEHDKPITVLFFGYVFALLPFFTFIDRATFLYHYFPALLFTIALLATLITRALAEQTKHAKMLAYGVIGILSVWGFIISAPYTYGL